MATTRTISTTRRSCSWGPACLPMQRVVRWARDRGLPVWGEMELGARLARRPYLAVTGTNGKTTVTSMIESCLRAGGLDALACGNIGLPFPEAALQDRDVLVVEVSSFQLALQESFHPSISVLVNLAPDHLDWHGSLEAYVDAKRRVYARQSGADVHIGNRDDPVSAPISAAAACEIRWFRSGPPTEGEVGFEGDELVARLDGIHRLGRVDGEAAGAREDAAAAAAVALAHGVEPTVVAAALASFRPAPHRGEVVASVDGVRFIDNSKATNVHAAAAAIDAAGSVVLIAGGRAKGADLSPLREHAGGVRAVIAIGEAAARRRRGLRRHRTHLDRGLDRGCRARRVRGRAPWGRGPAGAGVRELGSVPELCRAWGTVRGRGEVPPRGGGCPWLTARSPGGARGPRPPAGPICGWCVRTSCSPRRQPRPPWPDGTSRSCSCRRGS